MIAGLQGNRLEGLLGSPVTAHGKNTPHVSRGDQILQHPTAPYGQALPTPPYAGADGTTATNPPSMA